MISLHPNDALLIVDLQRDFLPGGALAVPDGDAVVPVLRAYLSRFMTQRLPIFLTRDWHPPNHCSFRAQGGPWPPHCVAFTPGALPPPEFQAPAAAAIIYKGIDVDRDAYSGFQDTPLHRHLQALGIGRLFVGGLATDYCVLNTVKDARALGYAVCLLLDAIKAVNLQPDDGRRAEETMMELGAVPLSLERMAA